MHRQQTEKDKHIVDFAPPWKNFCGRPWLENYFKLPKYFLPR